MLVARFVVGAFADVPPDAADALSIWVGEQRQLVVQRPGEAPRHGELPMASWERMHRAAMELEVARWGRVVGVGNAWASLRASGHTVHIRYRGPAGELRLPAIAAMPNAVAPTLVLLSRAALALEADSLSAFVDGLPEVVQRRGLLLRYRFTTFGAMDRATSVLLYTDGRLERWQLHGSEWSGTRVSGRRVPIDQIHHAYELASSFLKETRPMPPQTGQDPTEYLSLQVLLDGNPAETRLFSWGRGADAETTKVAVRPGDGARFAVLCEALRRLDALSGDG